MTEQEKQLGRDLLHDASTKARLLLETAEREAAALAATAAARRDARRIESQAEAEKKAADRIRISRALRETEQRRRRLIEADLAIQSVLDRAAALSAEGTGVDRRQSIEELLREAAAAVGGGSLIARLRPEDIALIGESRLTGLVRQSSGTAPSCAIIVIPDPLIGGGIVIESADGKRRFDNTIPARRKRLDKSFRLRIALALGYRVRTS